MYSAMLHHPDRDRADTSAPAALHLRRRGAAGRGPARRSRQRFGCAVLEGYGLSETSPVASFNHRDRERKPGSIGIPIDGVEMKLVDADGRASARSPSAATTS